MNKFKLDFNDYNSSYIGDGAYAHVDKMKRLWVFTYNGINVLDQVCMEEDAFDALCRFHKDRIQGNRDES